MSVQSQPRCSFLVIIFFIFISQASCCIANLNAGASGSYIFNKTGLNIFVHLHKNVIEMFEMMKSMFT